MTHPEATEPPQDLGTLIRSFRKADFPDHESMKRAIENSLMDAWRRLCLASGLLAESDQTSPQVMVDMKRGQATLTHTTGRGQNLAIRVVLKVSLWRQFGMVLIRVTGGHHDAMAEPLKGKRKMTSRNASLGTIARQIRELVDTVAHQLDGR